MRTWLRNKPQPRRPPLWNLFVHRALGSLTDGLVRSSVTRAGDSGSMIAGRDAEWRYGSHGKAMTRSRQRHRGRRVRFAGGDYDTDGRSGCKRANLNIG